MEESDSENVPPCATQRRCWKCHWVIPEVQMNNDLLSHTCFANYNEKENAIMISNDGVVSMTSLTHKNKKYAEEVRLLTAISKYPALYRTTERFQTSVPERLHMWKAIASLFPGRTVEATKNKWKNLRDQYTRAQDPKKYRHYDLMQVFVNEQSGCRETDDATIQGSSSNSKPTYSEADVQVEVDSPRCSHPSATPPGTSVQPDTENIHEPATPGPSNNLDEIIPSQPKRKRTTQKRRLSESNSDKDLQMLVLEKIREHKIQKTDPTDMFLLSLAPRFKLLDQRRQLRAHRRFLEILEEEYDNQLYEREQHVDERT